MSNLRNLHWSVALSALMTVYGGATYAHHVTEDQTQNSSTSMGVSGSSKTFIEDKGRLYCYAGTMGAVVTKGGKNYILSNNHVLAKENELLSYGSDEDSQTIIQPGLLDDESGCSFTSGSGHTEVADLTTFIPIAFGKGRNKQENYVDAAIAEIDNNAVGSNGDIVGIGAISGIISGPSGAIAVQKTGRTTQHTFGRVQAWNVSIEVKYTSGTALFVDQIRIRKICDQPNFGGPGDSGSVIVTVPSSGTPQAVGLLFAGSDLDTFANPMGAVQSALGFGEFGGSGELDKQADSDEFGIEESNCSTGGDDGGGGGGGSGGGRPGGGPPFGLSRGFFEARGVQERNSNGLFDLPDVVGHGIGSDAEGNAVIELYVSSRSRQEVGRGYPSTIDDVPVKVIRTGPIIAY